MSPSQIIVLATPVFLLLIAIEYAWGVAKGRNTYRLNDAVNSIGLGMLSQISAVLTRLLRVGIYTAVYGWVALWHNESFWMSWYGWLIALVFYDFCYYWLHRAGHEVAVFWAAHVVHHQSQDYNLSTALRQTSSGALLGWVFYLPMALAGVPPLVFGIVALIDLLYQFWVHTEHMGKLGWFDRWFCSPSNHRVHHAVRPVCGPQLRRHPHRLGPALRQLQGRGRALRLRHTQPAGQLGPALGQCRGLLGLLHDSWFARRWSDKLRVWLKPPGWRPADVAERFPKPAFDIARLQRYDPPAPRAVLWFGGLHFLTLLGGVVLFLWFADTLPLAASVVWLAALSAVLWCTGAVLQGRLTMMEVLFIEAAALSTACAATGLLELHRLFKPLTMLLAIFLAATVMRRSPTGLRGAGLLLLALAGSLAGDVFLMVPGYFIPGLVSFLCAHLAYIALFKRGQPWFPSRPALLIPLGFDAAMYAVLWTGGLPAGLRGPVAAYVLVIA